MADPSSTPPCAPSHAAVPSAPFVRSRLVRDSSLLAAGAALAAALILGAVYFFPLGDATGGPGEPPHAPVLASSPPAREAAQAMAPCSPAIILPTAVAPAAAEALQEETERAGRDLRERYPDLPEALHVAALMHAQLRQTAEAEKLWRQCVELAPQKVQYRVNLATVAMDRGDSELAAETLQQAVAQGSNSPDVLHHLGVALSNLGRIEEAEAVLQKAVGLYPRSAAHLLVLGQTQLKLGKAAEAEVSLRKAIDLGAQSAAAYFALANACARQSKHEEAAAFRKIYTELSTTQPLDAQERFQVLSTAEARRTAVAVLVEAATVHARQGDSLEAERLLLRALALDPASVPSCRALADLYHQAGMLAEERVVRRRLVELEPLDFGGHLNLAKVSAQLGEASSAEAALKLAMAMQPGSAAPYAALAEFCLEQGRTQQARWYAQEAVRRQPTAEGYAFLANTCRLLGDDAGAEAAFAMARKLNPDHSPQLP